MPQGLWLLSTLTPCCNKQRALPSQSTVKLFSHTLLSLSAPPPPPPPSASPPPHCSPELGFTPPPPPLLT